MHFYRQSLTNEFSNNDLPILEISTRCPFHSRKSFDFFDFRNSFCDSY